MIDYNPDPIYYQNIIPTQLDLSLVFLNNPPSNGNQWDMISLDFCFYDWLKKHPWKKTLLNESTPGMFDWWVKHPVNWVLMRYYLGNHSMHDDHDDVLWDSRIPILHMTSFLENPSKIPQRNLKISGGSPDQNLPSLHPHVGCGGFSGQPCGTEIWQRGQPEVGPRFFGTQKEDYPAW